MWLVALSSAISVLWLAVQYFEEILLGLNRKKKQTNKQTNEQTNKQTNKKQKER